MQLIDSKEARRKYGVETEEVEIDYTETGFRLAEETPKKLLSKKQLQLEL